MYTRNKDRIKYAVILTTAMLFICSGIVLAQNVSNYNEQGGARTVIGGSLDVVSGGDLDIESGGALKIAGTAVTSSAGELNAMDGVTSTAAELNLVDGSVVGNSVASKAALLDAGGDIRTASNVGAVGTGVTAVEYGDGYNHTTVLTLTITLPAIAGGANLGVGNLIYTLPTGAVIVDAAYMSVGITQSQGFINADTPDMGIGTVIASGVVAVLGGTTTFEDILTGQTVNDCTGTAEVKTAIPTAAVPLVIETGGAHTVYLNVADGWAANGDAAATAAGTVVINWHFMA